MRKTYRDADFFKEYTKLTGLKAEPQMPEELEQTIKTCPVTAKPWSYSKSSPAPTRCRKGKGTPMGYDITLINLNV